MAKRKTTQQEKEVFTYLNDLRETGVTNMFGAVPYIMDTFPVEKGEARKLLSLWMMNFNEEADYDEVEG